jgi:hypothetical protein
VEAGTGEPATELAFFGPARRAASVRGRGTLAGLMGVGTRDSVFGASSASTAGC